MPMLDFTQGSAREPVAASDLDRLRDAGVLVQDPRRERPRWFDGRFLAARDLIREQQYLLTREADLGRAAGSGVAQGLDVQVGSNPQTVVVAAGHGITPAGELVLLPRPLQVALAQVAQAEQLSARFGLGRLPNPPMRTRTGLFVLALRPVEYTSNPVGAYPSSLTGQRQVEDGDTIEATAVVLVPWPDDGAADALDARRGHMARAVFVAGGGGALSANVLPLALLALRNNTVEWVDQAMVRRELGADRGDLPGLGFSPRALRLAHLMQYQDHLDHVLQRTGGASFAAAAWFPALPSAGPLPPGVIDSRDFTQGFFPAEIDVDFSPLPDDELPALIEDALALQPIDLLASAESLDSTGVLIIAAVPRHEWRAVINRLASSSRVLKPAAPNLLAQRKPFEVLQRLRVPRGPVEAADPSSPSDAEWQRLARLPRLWFVRRRHIAHRDDYTGAWQAVSGVDERTVALDLNERLRGLGLAGHFQRLVDQASPAAAGLLNNLLSSRRMAESPALTAAAIAAFSEAARAGGLPAAAAAATAATGAPGEPGAPGAPATAAATGGPAMLAPATPATRQARAAGAMAPVAAPVPDVAAVPRLDLASVLAVAAELTAPGAGDGLARLEQSLAGGAMRPDTLRRLADGTQWRNLDATAQRTASQRLPALAQMVDAPTGGPTATGTATSTDSSTPQDPAGPATGTAASAAATAGGVAPVTGPTAMANTPAATPPATAAAAATSQAGSTAADPAAPVTAAAPTQRRPPKRQPPAPAPGDSPAASGRKARRGG